MTAFAITILSLAFPGVALTSEPTFPVMNTDEEPPDGVWFRNAPDPQQTDRVDGHGVYKGEHVRVKCFARGIPFGPHHNDVWYYAFSVERPTVGSRSNEGWINTHYVDDGMTADQAHPSVAPCGAAPARASTRIYFSPYDANDNDGKWRLYDRRSVATVYKSEFVPVCRRGSAVAYKAARDRAGGRPIATLAGWSSGRHGVLAYLKHASAEELKTLRYVILIDPGYYGQMGCDRTLQGGEALARWLMTNPDGHVVVISGSEISQQDSSKGIQEVYFNAIRNRSKPPHRLDLRPRVLTCNYTITHNDAFFAARYWIANEIGTSGCPRLRNAGRSYSPTAPKNGWHP